MQSLLFDISGTDPVTFALVTVLLALEEGLNGVRARRRPSGDNANCRLVSLEHAHRRLLLHGSEKSPGLAKPGLGQQGPLSMVSARHGHPRKESGA
jgi:hypothetical protein